MVLQTQALDIPFAGGGVHEEANLQLLPDGTFYSMSNVLYDKDGQLSARAPIVAGPTGSMATTNLLFKYRGNLYRLSGGGTVNGLWNDVGGAWEPVSRLTYVQHRTPSVSMTQGHGVGTGTAVSGVTGSMGVAADNASDTQLVVAYDAQTNVLKYTLRKRSTNAIIVQSALSGLHVYSVFAAYDRYIILFQDSGNSLYVCSVTFLGVESAYTTITGTFEAGTGACAHAAPLLDASGAVNGTGDFVVVYRENATNDLYQRRYTQTFTAAYAATAVDAANSVGAVSCAVAARSTETNFVITWTVGGAPGAVWARGFALAGGAAAWASVSLAAPTATYMNCSICYNPNRTVDAGGTFGAYDAWWTQISNNDFKQDLIARRGISGAGAVDAGGAQTMWRGARLYSHVVHDLTVLGSVCAIQYNDDSGDAGAQQSTVLLAQEVTSSTDDASTPVLLSRLLVGDGYRSNESGAMRQALSGARVAAGKFDIPVWRRGDVYGATGTDYTEACVFTVDSTARHPPHIEAANSVLIGGGNPLQFDGKTLLPFGFPVYPVLGVNGGADAIVNGGAGNVAVGTYGWVAVYTRILADGTVQRSTPSVVRSFAVAGVASTITVSVPSFRLSTATGPEYIELYRTLVGSSGPFYLAAIADNNSGADVVAIVDNSSDATIASNQQLYTTGGVLDNAAPAAISALWQQGDQTFFVTADAPMSVRVSKPQRAGFPLEFSDDGSTYVEVPDGGDITGFAVLGGTKFVWKRDSVYTFTGDGPNALGQGLFSVPERYLRISEGCASPKKLVEIPGVGVAWGAPSTRFWLLRLDGTVEEAGRAREDIFSSRGGLSFAVADAMNQRLYVYMTTASAAQCFVWDYATNVWTQFIDSLSTSTLSAGTAVVSNGTLYWARATEASQDANSTYKLNTAATDRRDLGTNTFTISVVTNWIKLGIAGFQRVKEVDILGSIGSLSVANHTINVVLYYDYNFSENSGTIAITHAEAGSPATSAPYLVRVKPLRQKCASMAVQLSLSGGSSTYDVPRLTGLTLHLAKKAGGAKLFKQAS